MGGADALYIIKIPRSLLGEGDKAKSKRISIFLFLNKPKYFH
jgi:hypothetical protein